MSGLHVDIERTVNRKDGLFGVTTYYVLRVSTAPLQALQSGIEVADSAMAEQRLSSDTRSPSWSVHRRYTQFEMLHEDLCSVFPASQLPVLPPKGTCCVVP
jgi:PX domain